MAAVLTQPPAPVPMDAVQNDPNPEDEVFMKEPPPEDIQFYNALTPINAMPLLAVSGVNRRGYWIGSLPVPPEEEASEEEEVPPRARR